MILVTVIVAVIVMSFPFAGPCSVPVMRLHTTRICTPHTPPLTTPLRRVAEKIF